MPANLRKTFDDVTETVDAAGRFGAVPLFANDRSQAGDLVAALDPAAAAKPAPPVPLPKPDDPLCRP
jgi:hypothetical protein